MEKIVPKIALILLALLIIAVVYFRETTLALKREVAELKSENCELKNLRDGLVYKTAVIAGSQSEIRKRVLAELDMTKNELLGKVRAYANLEVKFKDLAATLKSDTVVSVTFDSLGGDYTYLTFQERTKSFPGYQVSFLPSLLAPCSILGLKDRLSVSADINTKIDPIIIRMALTENSKGVWATYFNTDNPIFNSFGKLETIVSPFKPTFWDRLRFIGGGGYYGNKVCLKLGGAYSDFGATYNFGGLQGVDIFVILPISRIWRK